VIQAKVKLTTTASAAGPNAMIVFGYQGPACYRWVKITKADLQSGQTGAIGGTTAGRKKRVAKSTAVGKFVLWTVKVHADGRVELFPGRATAPAAAHRFLDGVLPSVVPGGVGLGASKAKAVFDNVKVWEDSALGD
jgi:hypothetical protein